MTGPATIGGAVAFVEPFEGWRAAPYQDPGGVWTYAWGSTRDLNGDPVTEATPPATLAEGDTLMARDLGAAAAELTRDVHVALTPHETIAIEDLIYNIGVGNFRSSTLLRRLNAKQFAQVAAQFDRWDHAGGRVLAGLLRRREAERVEFLKP
jgi:lysozyme